MEFWAIAEAYVVLAWHYRMRQMYSTVNTLEYFSAFLSFWKSPNSSTRLSLCSVSENVKLTTSYLGKKIGIHDRCTGYASSHRLLSFCICSSLRTFGGGWRPAVYLLLIHQRMSTTSLNQGFSSEWGQGPLIGQKKVQPPQNRDTNVFIVFWQRLRICW